MKLFQTLSLSVGILISFISCQDKQEIDSKIGRTNYAVVWTWETTDQDHILKYMSRQTDELNNLWEKDIVENVYINIDSKFPSGESFPTISFVIKAKSETGAKVYLDNMVFVKNSISSYQLYRVGTKYLGRNKETLDLINSKRVFVVVFQTTGTKEEIVNNIQEHSQKTLELWKMGLIENAYLNTDAFGNEARTIPAIAYFVNAEDKAGAEQIIAELPLVQKKLTRYQIHPVGVFWLGQSGK